MPFNLIDFSTWKRREYFDHYFNSMPCQYSLTINLTITNLLKTAKQENIKFYPLFIYLLTKLINKHEEFRFSTNAQGQLGVFEYLDPFYTVFQPDTETFTTIWTPYHSNFSIFYQDYLKDIETYGQLKQFIAKPNPPTHTFNISSIPWTSFTGFNLYIPKAIDYFFPIFTLGKYFDQNDQILLPFAIQVHHAVCDGFHVSRLINELQTMIDHKFLFNSLLF